MFHTNNIYKLKIDRSYTFYMNLVLIAASNNMEDISILKGEKLHECNQCRQSFTHMMVHSNHGEVKSYDSNQCSQNFNESEYLNNHMLLQSGKKTFICKQCRNYYNPIPGDLKKNMWNKAICLLTVSKPFSTFGYLKTHKSIHSKAKPCFCKQSPKSSTTSGDLKKHMFKYNEEKPHHCKQCLH